MLKKYNSYLNLEVLNEDMIKPDPPGVKKIYDTKSFYNEFHNVLNDTTNKNTRDIDKNLAELKKKMSELEKEKKVAVEKAKKDSAEIMVEELKKSINGKIIGVMDENGRQKILEVNDVILGNNKGDYYPVIFEDKERKVKYSWQDEGKAKLFDVGKFLDFFEEHFIDQLLTYQGKPIKGGDQIKYTKHVVRIGVHNGTTQDFIIVECDDKTSQLLVHTQPIKIMDMRLKTLDPYGEENWEN